MEINPVILHNWSHSCCCNRDHYHFKKLNNYIEVASGELIELVLVGTYKYKAGYATYALREATQAYIALEARQTRGSIILAAI